MTPKPSDEDESIAFHAYFGLLLLSAGVGAFCESILVAFILFGAGLMIAGIARWILKLRP